MPSQRIIVTTDNPIEDLNEHLSIKSNVLFRLRSSVCLTIIIKDKPWCNDDFRRAFDLKQEAHLQWTRDLHRASGARGLPVSLPV